MGVMAKVLVVMDLRNGLPSIRAFLLSEVLEFVHRVRSCAGVRCISLIGSLTTNKPNPKDADVLVAVADDADRPRSRRRESKTARRTP
jgi:hypothetical protein